MSRAIFLVLDSVGIGGAPDAADFGDAGSNTLGHVAEACADGRADRKGLRSGPIVLPNLVELGLGCALEASSGLAPEALQGGGTKGLWGHAREVSKGKDTPSGHWELAGVPVPFEWGYFPKTIPCFPEALTNAIVAEAGLPGILGNRHASGTDVLDQFGAESIRTGKPILYTSADSVLQIAAHEQAFGLERLYALCILSRRLVDPLGIGRVIARPFVGKSPADFNRTGNRRDYAIPPPTPTLLEAAANEGRDVLTVGKIADIYAHKGPTEVIKANGNAALFDATLDAFERLPDGGLLMTNLIDFDQLFGHRRDVAGYAACLEDFDRRLPKLRERLDRDDVVIITADHGCDPTWPGTDHTREQVPVLAFGPSLTAGSIGARQSFADVGTSLAAHLNLQWRGAGLSFL
jgi:phosphopentomutase